MTLVRPPYVLNPKVWTTATSREEPAAVHVSPEPPDPYDVVLTPEENDGELQWHGWDEQTIREEQEIRCDQWRRRRRRAVPFVRLPPATGTATVTSRGLM